MTKPLKSLLGWYWKKRKDKIYYCVPRGEDKNVFQIIGNDYVDEDEKKLSFRDKTLRIPEKHIQNKFGQYISFLDVMDGKPLAYESIDSEKLDTQITDGFLKKGFIQNILDIFGEEAKPNMTMIVLSLIMGTALGFGINEFIRYLIESGVI